MAIHFASLRKQLEAAGAHLTHLAVVEVAVIAGLVAVWYQNPNELLPMVGGAALGTIFDKFEKKQSVSVEEIAQLRQFVQNYTINASDFVTTLETYFKIYSTVSKREHVEMVSTILQRVDNHFSRMATRDQLDSLLDLFNQLIVVQQLPNAAFLLEFCNKQTRKHLDHLIAEGIYKPKVFIKRNQIEEDFSRFRVTSIPCFGLKGASGYGKTTFLAAIAEDLVKEGQYTLFYRASRLSNGFINAILHDFRFEIPEPRIELPTLLGWLLNCLEETGKEFFIFVDGIDEYPNNHLELQVQLEELAEKFKGSKMKICYSCKNLNWKEFAKELGDIRSILGKLTYSPTDTREPQDAEYESFDPTGLELPLFSPSELETAFLKYKHVYSLSGVLEGNTREECRDPFILRLVAETYADGEKQIPDTLNSATILHQFYKQKRSRIIPTSQPLATKLLSELAKTVLERNERKVSFVDLRDRFDWNDSLETAYREVLRVGFLTEEYDEYDLPSVSFSFDRVRNYIYVIPGEQWNSLRDKYPTAVATRIAQLTTTLLGIEVVEFFVEQIDKGKSRVLAELALLDFDVFASLLRRIRHYSIELTSHPDRTERFSRLEQYSITYSEIRKKYFSKLSTSLAPYEEGDVGVWISEEPLNLALTMSSTPQASIPTGGYLFQFRSISKITEKRVVEISLEDAVRLYNSNLNDSETRDLVNRLRPGGSLNISFAPLGNELPQIAAFEALNNQLLELFKTRRLLTSENPVLLEDKVIGLMIYEPHIWADKGMKSFAQLLSLTTVDQIRATPISDIIDKCYRLMLTYQLYSSRISADPEIEQYRWIHQQTYDVAKRLLVALLLLGRHRQQIETIHLYDIERRITPPHLMLEQTVQDMTKLLSSIRLGYGKFIDDNFSGIAKDLALYQHASEPVLVEVTHGNDGWIYISYVVFLGKNPLNTNVVRAIEPKEAVYYRLAPAQSLLYSHRHVWFISSHAAFPQYQQLAEEVPVAVYTTVLSDKYTVLEQVYKLTAVELADKFALNQREWRAYTLGSTSDKDNDRWTEELFSLWTRQRVAAALEHPIPGMECYWLECQDKRVTVIEASKVEESFLWHPPLDFVVPNYEKLAERLNEGGYIVEQADVENNITIITVVPPDLGISSQQFRNMNYSRFKNSGNHST